MGCGMLSDPKSTGEVFPASMVSIESKGQLAWLGSNDTSAALDEKPLTAVRFTYNYSIGKQEVSEGMFRQVMGMPILDVSDDSITFRSMTGISFYDAVRFCNALSKMEGLDTVYKYASVELDDSNLVKSMIGLGADFTRSGYRLPTEAEWVYAARKSSAEQFPWGKDTTDHIVQQYAWYLESNVSHVQPVGRKGHNALGICDMAGNALEMVWSWHGNLPGDTVTNYAGSDNPDQTGGLVVKGGSFAQDRNGLRIEARHDVYVVVPAMRAPYLGFRVAKGAISSVVLSDPTGKASQGTPIHIVATKDQIRSFFHTSQVRVALVNGTNQRLAVVDFFGSSVQVMEAVANHQVKHPTLSPDGRRIAFSTRAEGQSGESRTFEVPFTQLDSIQSLGAISAIRPRWWVDPWSMDTFLVSGDTGISNEDSLAWISGRTNLQPADVQIGARFLSNGNFQSGISSDGRFLASGYTRLRVQDNQDGSIRTLFQSPQNGKAADGSVQVCNVSIRPGEKPDLLFLDFGYPNSSSIAKSSYGIHELLFTMDIQTGDVLSHLFPPSGFTSWDYPLWSNIPTYAIASVTDASDSHRAVYAIRYPDGDTLRLLEGDELLMPTLWVDSLASALNIGPIEDSLGRYDTPANLTNLILHEKMGNFWRQDSLPELFIFGSSRELSGIHPSYLTGFRALNMASSGEGPYFGMQWAKEYLIEAARTPKVILLGIGPEFLANSFQNLFDKYFAKTNGYHLDVQNKYWTGDSAATARKYMAQIGAKTKGESLVSLDSLGWQYSKCNGWGKASFNIDDKWGSGSASWMDGWISMKKSITEATDSGVRVAAVILPMNPLYKKTPYYSRHGGLRTEVVKYLDSLNALAQVNPNFRLIDLHHDGDHDFGNKMAYDSDHLCWAGALRATDSIAARIKDWK